MLTSLSVRSEDGVQSLASGLSPDDESSELTTGGQSFQVKSIDIGDFNTGNISESFNEFNILIRVHNKGSFFSLVSLVSEFTLSGSEGLAINNFLNVFESSESFQESNSLVGLFERFKSIFNNQRHFGDLTDFVSSSLN